MNKEQLKEAVGELNLVDTVFEYDGVSYIDTAVSVMQVYDLIDQLDEPEITLNEAFNKLEETHILSKEEMVKHFEQLEIHNGKVTYGDYETLSQKWIDSHRKSYTMEDSVEISDLQNLIVPKQEEVDRAYKDGYEKGKEHTFYKGYLEGLADKEKEPETVASVIADFYKSFERFKEVISMEVEELEE